MRAELQQVLINYSHRLAPLNLLPDEITYGLLKSQAEQANLHYLIQELSASGSEPALVERLAQLLKEQWQGTLASVLHPFNNPQAIAYQLFIALREQLHPECARSEHLLACFKGEDWGLRWLITPNLDGSLALILEKHPLQPGSLDEQRWRANAYVTDGQFVLDYHASITMMIDVLELPKTNKNSEKKQKAFVRQFVLQFFNQLKQQYPALHHVLIQRNAELADMANTIEQRPILRDVLIELKNNLFAGGKVVQGDSHHAGRVAYLAVAKFTDILSQLSDNQKQTIMPLIAGVHNKNLGEVIRFLDEGGCVEMAADDIQAIVNHPANARAISQELVLVKNQPNIQELDLSSEQLKSLAVFDPTRVTKLSGWVMGQWLTYVESQQMASLTIENMIEISRCLDADALEYFITYAVVRGGVRRQAGLAHVGFVSPTTPLHAMVLSSLVELSRPQYLIILGVLFDPSFALPVIRNYFDLYLMVRALSDDQTNDLVSVIDFKKINDSDLDFNMFLSVSQHLPEQSREKLYEATKSIINILIQNDYRQNTSLVKYLKMIHLIAKKYRAEVTGDLGPLLLNELNAHPSLAGLLWDVYEKLPIEAIHAFIQIFQWGLFFPYFPQKNMISSNVILGHYVSVLCEEMLKSSDWPSLSLADRFAMYHKIPQEYSKRHFERDSLAKKLALTDLKDFIDFLPFMSTSIANQYAVQYADEIRRCLREHFEGSPNDTGGLILLFRNIFDALSGEVRDIFYDDFIKTYQISVTDSHDYYQLFDELNFDVSVDLWSRIRAGENFQLVFQDRILNTKEFINTVLRDLSTLNLDFFRPFFQVFFPEIFKHFRSSYFSNVNPSCQLLMKERIEDFMLLLDEGSEHVAQNLDEMLNALSWMNDPSKVRTLLDRLRFVDSEAHFLKLLGVLDQNGQAMALDFYDALLGDWCRNERFCHDLTDVLYAEHHERVALYFSSSLSMRAGLFYQDQYGSGNDSDYNSDSDDSVMRAFLSL